MGGSVQTTDTTTAVEHAAGGYGYDYEAVSPLAMQRGLPREELPSGASR